MADDPSSNDGDLRRRHAHAASEQAVRETQGGPGPGSPAGLPINLIRTPAWAGPIQRTTHRISTFYALNVDAPQVVTTEELSSLFHFGRLQRFYTENSGVLPSLLAKYILAPDDMSIGVDDAPPGNWLRNVEVWWLRIPHNGSVIALILDVDAAVSNLPQLVEATYYADKCIKLRPPAAWAGGHTLHVSLADFALTLYQHKVGAAPNRAINLLPEYYQLISLGYSTANAGWGELQQIIYRANAPAQAEYSRIILPSELNRRPTWTAAVGQFVSVLGGQQEYIEGAINLFVAQHVAALARMRSIADHTRNLLAVLDPQPLTDFQRADGSRVRSRSKVGELIRELDFRRATVASLEQQRKLLEVRFQGAVRGNMSVFLLVESGRLQEFQRAINQVVDFEVNAQQVANMLDRLERALAAETRAIDALQAQVEYTRRRIRDNLISLASVAVIPPTLVFAFFSGAQQEVKSDQSMFSAVYWPLYAGIVLLVLLLALTFVIMKRRSEARIADSVAYSGVALSSEAFDEADALEPTQKPVRDLR